MVSRNPNIRIGTSHQLAVALIFASAQFIIAVDATGVNIALPAIQHAFALSRTELQWVVTGFALPFGGFMLVGGRSADIYGPRRVFLAGIAAFSVSSLSASVSASALMLIISRASEGLSCALMAPAALALLTTTFPQGAERNRALAINGAMLSAGFVYGLFIGAALTTLIGWRAVFLANLPFGFVITLLTCRWTADERRRPGEQPLDVGGAVIATAGILALTYAVTEFGGEGRVTPASAALLCIGAAFIAGFSIVERRGASPLVPGRLASDPAVAAGSVTALLVSASGVGMIFLLTLYLQQGLGYTPIHTAAILAALGVAATLAGAQTARGVARWGAQRVLFAGVAIQFGGAVVVVRATSHGTIVSMVVGTALSGCGFALALVASTVVVSGSVADGDQGAASGLLNAALELGAGLGVATLVAVAVATSGNLRSSGGAPSHAVQVAAGTRHGIVAVALLLVAAAVASLFVPRDRDYASNAAGSHRAARKSTFPDLRRR